jgi:hypothetical protein
VQLLRQQDKVPLQEKFLLMLLLLLQAGLSAVAACSSIISWAASFSQPVM